MNTETGKILVVNDEKSNAELQALMMRGAAVAISADQMTEKQAKEQQVSLHDHTSELGQMLTRIRRVNRCGAPHVGAKQLAKLANREALKNASSNR